MASVCAKELGERRPSKGLKAFSKSAKTPFCRLRSGSIWMANHKPYQALQSPMLERRLNSLIWRHLTVWYQTSIRKSKWSIAAELSKPFQAHNGPVWIRHLNQLNQIKANNESLFEVLKKGYCLASEVQVRTTFSFVGQSSSCANEIAFIGSHKVSQTAIYSFDSSGDLIFFVRFL